MKYSLEQVSERFSAIPEELQDAILEADLSSKVQNIASNNKLLLDQAGVLEEIINYVLLGLESRNSFIPQLVQELGITREKAEILAKEVNNSIFLPIREYLVEKNEGAAESIGTKEDLLAEIENPLPVAHPISVVDQTIPGPAKPLEIIPEEHKEATHEFIANTLAGKTISPAKTAEIELKPKQPEKPKDYQADPYREPIQ